MSKVLVDPAALEEAAKWLEVHSSSSGSAEAFAAEALREAIAQPAEAEGVQPWRERIIAAHPKSEPGYWPDELLVAYMQPEIEELRAALSAVTAERDRLRKDAERYRWLCVEGNWVARMFGKWRAHIGEYGENKPTDWFDSRDAAIDSAMAAKEA